MDEIEARVQQKVMTAIQEQHTSNGTDAAMEDDAVQTRVSQLESQVTALQSNYQQLASTVTTNHQQQSQHNTQISHQIQAVQTQQQGMQSAIEMQLDRQMKRIEELLELKRAKLHE